MYSPNGHAKRHDLGSRYGEIGISAVAAVLHWRGGGNWNSGTTSSEERGTDAIQKADRMGNGGRMRGSCDTLRQSGSLQ
jgi:hypothetical protein